MKKRLLSVLLAMVLASGTIPAIAMPVLAEETSGSTETEGIVDSGQCGYSAQWSLNDDGVLSITGTGALYLNDIPWSSYFNDIKEVDISDGITKLPNRAFNYCSSLEKVTLPDTLTEIPEWCFYVCSSLKSIKLPDNLKKISNYAFSGCSALTSVKIPENITEISPGAFEDCQGIQSVELSNSIVNIREAAFQNCTSLTTVSGIPNTLTYIGGQAFKNCSKLITLDLSNTILSNIDNEAFEGCTSLESLILPHTIKTIGTSAFSHCGNDNLRNNITFKGSPRQFDAIDIGEDNDAIVIPVKKYEYRLAKKYPFQTRILL